jgi:hypothetical protein
LNETTTGGDHRHKQRQNMKPLKYLLLAVAAATTFGAALSAQAEQPFAIVRSPQNAALLASPRYLEAHPELLRVPSVRRESTIVQMDRQATLAKNTALASSPRFREAHPELRWSSSPTEQLAKRNVSRSAQWNTLTSNKALAASPRYREQHPELLRGQPVFEIAPLK